MGAIPNREIEQLFKADILGKFRRDSGRSCALRDIEVAFYRSDSEAFRSHVENFLVEAASYFDTSAESFYQSVVVCREFGLVDILTNNKGVLLDTLTI